MITLHLTEQQAELLHSILAVQHGERFDRAMDVGLYDPDLGVRLLETAAAIMAIYTQLSMQLPSTRN